MFGRTARRLTRRQFFSSDQAEHIPISEQELLQICSKLVAEKAEEGFINVLDPYCGEGQVLQELALSLDAETRLYGIEENREKRRKAKKIADKAVLGTYADLHATNGVFSLIFFNPPAGGYNPIGLPREAVAFGDLSFPGKYLYPGAVMIIVLRREIIKDIAHLLSLRFVDIELGQISQDRVVIFAIRSKGRVENKLAKEQKEYLLLAQNNPASIPTLSEKKYIVPLTQNEVKTFRGYLLDDEDLAEDLEKSPLWGKVSEILAPQSRVIKAPKPLLPLNTTHVAVAAAAGVINGRTGDHYRKGITKEYIEAMSLEEDDATITVETKRYVSRVRIFSQDGVFDLEH